ncbi:carbohydrate esterase family 12 protein [Plenodomus tracheiphilus IPT5]|uniref:Carbohydrate esterase family 12 protein n=1 Tax=Plenodomus tracheiphilus IPT5 TaxID=1408161 RepID=A0A6A7BEM0_9PLEO|nr:carbohydrate esterase family 12 protein [Plenodomus tracheiphilus IPT5]
MRLSLLSLLPLALAAPATLVDRAAKPVYWLLAGDSTTAPKGGWGDAFLSTTVASGSSGHNYGHSGATTKSFRIGGDWAEVIKDIGTYKEDYRVYVTIQFGHNDQKATSGVTLADYKTNLGNFSAEVVAAGGTPILVTPLTRRSFDSKTKRVIENLSKERATTIDVANSKSYHYIDLNKASTDYVNAIGSAEADKYNLAAGDRTHLNEHGGVVFSRIVSDLIVQKYPSEFDGFVKKDDALSALIKAGKPA